ncbi:MAG: endo-1,4-beta-xylanase [candidate division KSB1 bacterium]|nr:endo-1,4-beta-xylanase [candidate division KSB1 bacterium]
MKIRFFAVALVIFPFLINAQEKGLKDYFQNDFLIGTAPGFNFEKNENLVALIKKHFNVLTPENQMKWEPIHPQPDRWEFAAADTLVNFAQRHGMKVIGHTLVWHSQTPRWVFQHPDGTPLSRDELLARMQEHITTVMTRYKGKIHGWDVVNEAIMDPSDGDEILRNSPYKKIIGEDYLEYAFRFAKAADPGAELYYNDYSMADPKKREKALILLKGLLDKGVPIDAVGMQGHWSIYDPPIEEIEKSILAYHGLGLKVMITELDLSLYKFEDRRKLYEESIPDSILQLQAKRYGEIFSLFKKHSDKITRVTFWGVTDRYSWLNGFPVPNRRNAPLLFDRDYKPKPALDAIIRVAQGQ